MKITPPKARDLRLDFFRGLSLLIIFVAHAPNNWLALYKPGNFGFSDSADIFVFVSGCTSAFAYGTRFLRAGFLAGTARIVKRCARLYGCHPGLFFTLAMLCVAGNLVLDTGEDYIGLLNLGFFRPHQGGPGPWFFNPFARLSEINYHSRH